MWKHAPNLIIDYYNYNIQTGHYVFARHSYAFKAFKSAKCLPRNPSKSTPKDLAIPNQLIAAYPVHIHSQKDKSPFFSSKQVSSCVYSWTSTLAQHSYISLFPSLSLPNSPFPNTYEHVRIHRNLLLHPVLSGGSFPRVGENTHCHRHAGTESECGRPHESEGANATARAEWNKGLFSSK